MCRFYNFTDDHVLKMPVARFFLLLESAEKIEGRERAFACYIARSAQMNKDAFESTVNYFMNTGSAEKIPDDLPESTTYEPREAMPHTEAKNALFGLMGSDPRINRKVVMDPKPTHPRWRN